ncbi:tetratricopeptide repeat protein [Plantactinospora sp. KLBMP9567]|uniref:tetratricopeptide repeat protein n=1 Tax=Plantactinospora sp. KLBMP9567 TaxID=3085900 RepID=UPI002981A75E|nr:tetratricopeptide repeat protein [Plantactinospora sp. KLBMP9567]MDW5323687.1 tetratricopeptide repeat protein [Plantactinospora sp. KLBMP9567]
MRDVAWGRYVRSRRKELGWTQEELARRAGLSVRTVRNVEGERPGADRGASVHQLARVLGLRGDDDLGQPEPGEPAGWVRLAVLGPLRLSRGSEPVPLTAAKPRCMLALLAIQPGTDVGRDEIADVLWPDTPPATWHNLLHTYAARLRRLLPAGPGLPRIDSTAVGYRLSADARQLDVLRFRQLTDDAGTGRPDAERLAEALDCWRGPVGADLPDQLGQHPAAVALHQRRITAALDYADLALAEGEAAAVVRRLGVLVELEPVHEPLHARLVRALAGSGQRAAAVDAFHRIRARLDDELGLYPGAELAAALDHALRDDQRGAPPPAPPPAQLPTRVAAFVGRTGELATLDKLLSADEPGATVALIHGTAGVGKTTLAVHWAHRAASHFPDGQLHLNLRGYDRAGAVLDPAAATRAFLEALGVRPERIPESYLGQQGLYRSLVADRRLLVLLDNARDAEQVRPLLPTATGSMALVTSRDSLLGLVATDRAHPVPLGLFTLDEARDFLADRISDDRAGTEPEAVEQLIGWCARLPLALAVTAALAVSRPGRSLASLAAELAEAGDLDTLSAGDPATDLRAVFFCSYRTLSVEGARLFRHLGLHPGPTITVPAAASLLGATRRTVRRLLDELHRAHLVATDEPGRYALHDLLRAYAGELAEADAPPAERAEALDRILDHYLHTAHEADRRLYVRSDSITPAEPAPGAEPERFADEASALAWFDAERLVLLRVIDLAADAGRATHTWQLAWSVSMFLNRRVHWQDWVHVQQRALESNADRDDLGQAQAHRFLGLVYLRMSRADEAHEQLRQALELFRQLGDRPGEASTERGIGRAYARQGRHDRALAHTEKALELFRTAGNRVGTASALNATGWYHAQLGDYHTALQRCREAVRLHEEQKDVSGLANAWDSLGYAYHGLGNHPDAIACYQRAVEFFRAADDRYGETDALTSLGDTQLDAGDPGAALSAWRAALAILIDVGHPDAARVRARIAGLGRPGGPGVPAGQPSHRT